MSQEIRQTELREATQQLLRGPLKHIRVAALAAALLPLASVAAAPAAAQTSCANSAGVCGTVFNDVSNNGILEPGDTGIEGIKVTACQLCNGTDNVDTYTDVNGYYSFGEPLQSQMDGYNNGLLCAPQRH
jgi:opacity protein-like surface antigen